MTIRIASWNVNSVRIRIPILKRLMAEKKPDILCLQETKVEDQHFPINDLKALGFKHIQFAGQKSYNGVAILSKVKLDKPSQMTLGGIDHKRHLAVTLPDGTQLHNFYVPAGGDIPDVKLNPAYAHKLRFVEDMTAWSKKAKKAGKNMVIVGDFNIAPLEHDVWSHKQLLNVVSHTPPEVERLTALQNSHDWCDTGRHFTPNDQKLYSWWSYRNRDWKKSNRGRRLDHIWVTPSLKNALKRYDTHVNTRDWESTSDHVPRLVDIDL